MASAELVGRVFKVLDVNGDGYLDSAEFKLYAIQQGFDGSDEDWVGQWEELITDCKWDAALGPSEFQFFTAVQDSEGSCSAEVEELEAILKVLPSKAADANQGLANVEDLDALGIGGPLEDLPDLGELANLDELGIGGPVEEAQASPVEEEKPADDDAKAEDQANGDQPADVAAAEPQEQSKTDAEEAAPAEEKPEEAKRLSSASAKAEKTTDDMVSLNKSASAASLGTKGAPARTHAAVIKSSDPDAGSVSITIIGTAGLKKVKQKGKPDRWCACEAPGTTNSMYKTAKVPNNLNPTWTHDIQIANYKYASCLQFTVMDEDVLATCSLATAEFYPAAFTGSIPLMDAKNKKIPKAVLKVEVKAVPPLRGEPREPGLGKSLEEVLASSGGDESLEEGEDGKPAGENDEGNAEPPKRRQGRFVNFNEFGEPEDPHQDLGLDLETRSWQSSNFAEESSADGDEDERRRKAELSNRAASEEDADELLRCRARAGYNIAAMEKLNPGLREETDPLSSNLLGSSALDARVVWVCGSKVTPCNFRSPIQKKIALAGLVSGTPAVKVFINRVSGSKAGGWKLRWDCCCSCQVTGSGNNGGNKFQTDMVKNSPMPTWNADTEFPSLYRGDALDFAVEGVDKDGWPKTPGILGRAQLPQETLGDEGFEGELKLSGSKAEWAKLRVEVSVLCLWDTDTDQKVPHERTKEALQAMTAKASRAAQLAWERDQALAEPRFQELDVAPCNVFDLLVADSDRRRCNESLHRKITSLSHQSPVKKQPWVWKEVNSVFDRIIYNPPTRGIAASPGEEKSRNGVPEARALEARDPRPHLNAATHPDDARGPRHDIDGADLAMWWPKNKIQVRAWRSDESEDDQSEHWEECSGSEKSPYGKRRPVSADEAEAVHRVVANVPELLTWKEGNVGSGPAPPPLRRATLDASLDQDPNGIPRKFSMQVEERIRLESLRRASVAGTSAGRYQDMRPLLQAAGIKPSELMGPDSDESDVPRRRVLKKTRHSVAVASPTAAALARKLKASGTVERNSIGAISMEKGRPGFGKVSAKAAAASGQALAKGRRSIDAELLSGTEEWALEAFGEEQKGISGRARGKSMFEGSHDERVQAMKEFSLESPDKDKQKKSKKEKKDRKGERSGAEESEGKGEKKEKKDRKGERSGAEESEVTGEKKEKKERKDKKEKKERSPEDNPKRITSSTRAPDDKSSRQSEAKAKKTTSRLTSGAKVADDGPEKTASSSKISATSASSPAAKAKSAAALLKAGNASRASSRMRTPKR